jgi:hypothetical protein
LIIDYVKAFQSEYPQTVPGIVEVENYVRGKNNVDFYDSTVGNEGKEWRDGDVDICEVSSGQFVICYATTGEVSLVMSFWLSLFLLIILNKMT